MTLVTSSANWALHHLGFTIPCFVVAYIVFGRMFFVAIQTARDGVEKDEDFWVGAFWPFALGMQILVALYRFVVRPVLKLLWKVIFFLFGRIIFPIFTRGVFPAVNWGGTKLAFIFKV